MQPASAEELEVVSLRVTGLEEKVSRLEQALERQNNLVVYLLQAVTELKESSPVPPRVRQEPIPIPIAFEDSTHNFNITNSESTSTVRGSPISSSSHNWLTVLSKTILTPPPSTHRLETRFEITSTPNSNVMMGFALPSEVSTLRTRENTFIGRLGWAVHCRNGKKCHKNMFRDAFVEIDESGSGLRGGDVVVLFLEFDGENGTYRIGARIREYDERILFEGIPMGMVEKQGGIHVGMSMVSGCSVTVSVMDVEI